MLRKVESKLLSFLKTSYRGFYVDIGPVVGEEDKIWTISLNSEAKDNVPLVMIHGLGAGVALWILNLDSLAAHRPVHAMDTLGFGRSSRPTFSSDAMICEKQFVRSIEEWRSEMKIPQMILFGHSLGGFLASSYALSYPDRVKHLILAEPWGFPQKPSDTAQSKTLPLWVRAIAYTLTPLNPLWAIRAAGPFGEMLVEKLRPDITRKFSVLTTGEHSNLIPQYIHQCNAQKPSGEAAFHAMMEGFGWAKHPMINRLHEVRKDIPMTFIYGSRSWMDSATGKQIQTFRADSSVSMRIVSGAGHHVYADKADVFNKHVNEACALADSNSNSIPNISSVMDVPQILPAPQKTGKDDEVDSNDEENKKTN